MFITDSDSDTLVSSFLVLVQGSRQGILAYRAGMHETKKNIFFMFYACISLQNMQKCTAIHFASLLL
jgi:hypothetical protein